MRGLSKTPPKYRKHRASGQAVITLNGVDFYLGPFGTAVSKSEYDRLIGEWLVNGKQLPDLNVRRPITIAELTAKYWQFCKTYYVKNGLPTDEQAGVKIALRHLNKKYRSANAIDFGPLSLEAVRQQMIETGNSRGYINQNVGRIRRMFKWAVSKEVIPVTVYQSLLTVTGLKKGKCRARETGLVMPVDEDVVAATIACCSKQTADMIRFQQLTGCRPGEVCTIKPIEIDREHEVWRYTPGSHKMEHRGRHRVILIGPKAQSILQPYLTCEATRNCFVKPSGKPFQRWDYNRRIHQACDKAFPAPEGVKGAELKAWRKQNRWAPNRLRHTRATTIRKQFGLEASQAVLGHSKADTTLIYAERDIEKAAKVMGEIG